MPRPPKTDEEIAAMQAHILDIAHDLLRESGPGAVSVRRIAERLGVSHMTLYTYFPNQQAILRALGERQHAQRLARMAEHIQEAEQGNVVAIVQKTLSRFGQFAQHAPQVFHLLFMTPVCSWEGPPHARGQLSADMEHLAQLVKIGIQQGAFVDRDPQQAAWVVFSILLGPLALDLHGRFPSRQVFDNVWEEALEIAMNYLKGS